ncbi:MAG TPA: protein kinase [Polyangia bacterium]|nr:protein kinase [Polyangia bacterium]
MAPGRDSLAVSAQQGQPQGPVPGQLQPGAVVGGRFRLEALIGQDAVSQTYRAADANRRGPAAVRVIPVRAVGTAAAQLVTDIENASALVHKNLIEVLTAGREADYIFIATELLDGQTLREFIDGKRTEGHGVSFKGACNLITHVANGLERAAGFMPHGGLNPASIWVNKAGRVKVADLGLARTVPALARRGAPAGAPDHLYVAPEVLAGAPPTSASDVYSMAMLLYEVLTGHLPTNPFVPASQAVPEVPPVVDAILAKAFAGAPEHRFATPMELRDALAATLAGGAPNLEVPAAPRAAAAAPAVQAAPPVQQAEPAASPRSTLGRTFNVAQAAGAAIDESQERWLVQKDRLDFGPFSLAQIRAQIARGEILGEHLLVDSDTGERQKVKDFPLLREFTRTSERHREQNRRAVAEQNAEKSDKRKSIFTFVFVLVALGAAVGGVVFYVWTRKAGDDTKIASRTDDADIDAFLKDVKLSFQKATVAKRGSGGGHHAGGDSEFSNDSNFGDASKYAAAGDETLDGDVIEETMMHHYRGLVPCLMAERKHNPGLTEMSLEFVIRGTGKVSAVKVNGQRGGFASCVQGRMPTFPKFNGAKTIASWSMSMR